MELLQTGAVERTVRLDPRTKLVLLVSVSTVLLIGGNGTIMDAARTIMLLAPFGLLAVSGRRGAAAALLAAYAGAQALSALVVPNVDGPLNFLIVASCMIAARFLPTIATAYFVFATTTVSEFMAAAERVHAPQWLVIPLSVLFRFFPTLGEEARAIGSAMRMRGLRGPSSWSNAVSCRSSPARCRSVRICRPPRSRGGSARPCGGRTSARSGSGRPMRQCWQRAPPAWRCWPQAASDGRWDR